MSIVIIVVCLFCADCADQQMKHAARFRNASGVNEPQGCHINVDVRCYWYGAVV